MREQITLYDLQQRINLYSKGKTEEQLKNTLVFLGNDEELNGLHPCFYIERLDKQDEENMNAINDSDYKLDNNILLS